jgi:hypothetical protein
MCLTSQGAPTVHLSEPGAVRHHKCLFIYIQPARLLASDIGSACGLGASPAPGLREPARAAPRMRKYRRAARLGCNGARWSTRSSTAVTTDFVRGHRAPVTTNNRRLHRDSHHRCTRMCKRSNLPPASSRSSPTSSNTNLTGPVATPAAPCGVICLLQPAWIK